jgi:hypothetical protein
MPCSERNGGDVIKWDERKAKKKRKGINEGQREVKNREKEGYKER